MSQANAKTREGREHPDREAQFVEIAKTSGAAITAGQPAIRISQTPRSESSRADR